MLLPSCSRTLGGWAEGRWGGAGRCVPQLHMRLEGHLTTACGAAASHGRSTASLPYSRRGVWLGGGMGAS